MIHRLFIFFLSLFLCSNIFAEDRTVDLLIDYKTVHFAGKSRQAIAVNDQIPAPTLHFKEGDHVKINVYNHLDKGTAVHWHGLIIPWQMDGVEGVTQEAIPPGGVFHYEFTLHQTGTYWYHAHSGFQEQQGLYGAFIIDPIKPPSYQYTKDVVVVLSDWSNTTPENMFANLKKEGGYYSSRFPLQPSFMRFVHDYRQANTQGKKTQVIDDYKMMQQMRMSIYDLSDVAYDAFLLNGHPASQPWTESVKVGDVVRLRFIGAGGSTNFHVKIANSKMEMVHVQGNDVKPYEIDQFFITPGETYDVLVKIQKDEPYLIYAESADTLGVAVGALTTNPSQTFDYKQVTPFPEPLPVTREMMSNMMPDMEMDQSMDMDMPTESSITGDTISPPNSDQEETSGTKYQDLTAAIKTNDPNKPVSGVIKMELFGYMERFNWFINGLPEYKVKPIPLEEGKRYQIIFTNNSMMHHPMHIHGHWFIVRNEHGEYDPLLHTIDVPPGGTVVADVDANASGQWFFHCHHLYHMMSGMSRVFQYTTIIDMEQKSAHTENNVTQQSSMDLSLIHHPMAHPAGLYLANFLDAGEDPFNNAQKVTFKGLYGGDYNKIELFGNDAEINKGSIANADLDIFYWHLISQFWAIKGGANYFYAPSGGPYWQPGIGIEGLMPYFIDTDFRIYYHSGSVKFDAELSRDTQITNNFFVRTGVRSIFATKSVVQDEIGSGLNQMRYIVRPYYRLMPGLDIFSEFENENEYGDLANIRSNAGESTVENTVTFGFSVLF